MIEIAELVAEIPDGKKRAYLGQLFVKALTDYYDNYGEEEIDLNGLVVRNFKDLILNDDIIKDLKLFCENKILALFEKP